MFALQTKEGAPVQLGELSHLLVQVGGLYIEIFSSFESAQVSMPLRFGSVLPSFCYSLDSGRFCHVYSWPSRQPILVLNARGAIIVVDCSTRQNNCSLMRGPVDVADTWFTVRVPREF